MTMNEPSLPPSPDSSPEKQLEAGISPNSSTREVLESGQEEVPDGGYGWVIVGCLTAITALSWGINTIYGVYSAYYQEENYYQGGSAFNYAWIGGLSIGTALALAPAAQWISQYLSLRMLFLLGAVCVSLGQVLAGICKTFPTFALCQGFLFGIGLGMILVPSHPLLCQWFNHRLSLAQGLFNAGSGLGGLIFAQTTRLALQRVGVKYSLIINGCVSFAVLLPCVFLIKERRSVSAKKGKFNWGCLRHPGLAFVYLWGAFAIAAFCISLFTLASFTTNGLGLSQSQGATVQSVLAVGQLVGRVLWGFAADRAGRVNMAILCYFIAGISCLALWLPAKSYPLLIVFTIIQGLVAGVIWSMAAPVALTVGGPELLESALTVIWTCNILPALVAQPIAVTLINYSKDSLHRSGADAYAISIGLCGGLGLAAALALCGAKRYVQKDFSIMTRV